MVVHLPRLALAALALAILACGHPPAREHRPARSHPSAAGAPAERFLLEGRILDARTRLGLPGAALSVQPESGPGPVLRAVTDGHGGFRVEGLKAGVAYRAATQPVVGGRAYAVRVSGRILPEPGADLAPLDLACEPAPDAGAIAGAAPRPGVVRLLWRAPLEGGGDLRVVLRTSAERGGFHFEAVPAGDYLLSLGPVPRGEAPLRPFPRRPDLRRTHGPFLVTPELPVRVGAGAVTQVHWPDVKAGGAAGPD